MADTINLLDKRTREQQASAVADNSYSWASLMPPWTPHRRRHGKRSMHGKFSRNKRRC